MHLSSPRRVRPAWRALAATLLGFALVVPLSGTAQAAPRFPDRIELPDGFLPEGITIGPGKQAYLGSRADGDIYRVNLETGKGQVISQGPGTPSVGLKSDQRGLLYVAGGSAGDARIVSTASGKVVKSYQFATPESVAAKTTFINDVVLTRTTAWFTDSLQATLYGVPLARHGKAASAAKVTALPLSGDWVQAAGVNNANGISTTPDRRALLVIQSNTGSLFRVNPRTGKATLVDLGRTVLTAGDGLLRKGRTLYVVQNRLNQVAVVKLNRSGTRGFQIATLFNPDFDVPTTIAAYGKNLYLPNARFTSPQTPDTEGWVTKIRRY